MKTLIRRKKEKDADNLFIPKRSNPGFFGAQANLKVGKPNDKYEQEADNMADIVVQQTQNNNHNLLAANNSYNLQNSLTNSVQEKPLAESITPFVQKQQEEIITQMQPEEEEEPVQAQVEEEEEEAVQMQEEEEDVQAQVEEEEEETVQAQVEEEEEEAVQMQEEEEAIQAQVEEEEAVQMQEEEEEMLQAKTIQKNSTSEKTNRQSSETSMQMRLNKKTGKGNRMDKSTRTEMESGFGADFSKVNIHTDNEAVQMSKELGAQAFTKGNDIYFNKGKYNPESTKGKHLLAHELTHTIQQSSNKVSEKEMPVSRAITTPLKGHVKNPNQKSGKKVTFTVNGIKVIVKPDGKLKGKANNNRAKTNFKFSIKIPTYKPDKKGKIKSLSTVSTPKVTIQTLYGKKVNAQSQSGYGKGTTKSDVTAGNISLGYHEGSHGTDILNFIKNTPIPQFNCQVGDSIKKYKKAKKEYKKAWKKYQKDLNENTTTLTDCVGTKASFCPATP